MSTVSVMKPIGLADPISLCWGLSSSLDIFFRSVEVKRLVVRFLARRVGKWPCEQVTIRLPLRLSHVSVGFGNHQGASLSVGSGDRTTEVARHVFLELVTQHNNASTFGIKGNCTRYVLFSGEKNWKYEGRAFLYAIVLLYFFVGMAAITAIFMKSVETIVRQTRRVKWTNPVTQVSVIRSERIWNSSLADITLLALGTSAPPLAISIIDAFQQLGQAEDGG